MVGLNCERFVDQLLAKELKCGICLDVVSEAVDTQCRHTFCYQCLNQWLCGSSGGQMCPQCRRRLTDDWRTSSGDNELIIGGRVLVDKNRKVNAIVGKMTIKCDYEWNGCPHVCPLDSLSAHIKTCAHRLCPTCGLSTAGQTPDGHNCVQELRKDRIRYLQKYKALKSECISLRSATEELAKQLIQSEELCRDLATECASRAGPEVKPRAMGYNTIARPVCTYSHPNPPPLPFITENSMVRFGTFQTVVHRLVITEWSVRLLKVSPMRDETPIFAEMVLLYGLTQELLVCPDPALTILCLRPKHSMADNINDKLFYISPNNYQMNINSKDPIHKNIVILIHDNMSASVANRLMECYARITSGSMFKIIDRQAAQQLLYGDI
ncbi:unnamed protein product [Medioppia subpectinata]|uniref:RING-type domain-containing protein n=1 Tax=Medioppia subpectinata TaxID=1979941 RepID=A0A7R9LCS7_9ACAR|nr:unnamed protein product [Medioppia subpectinata]CAG2117681.1 unnamed protein product [Medioppia subpectinata]